MANNTEKTSRRARSSIHHTSFEDIGRGTANDSAKTRSKRAKSVSRNRIRRHAELLSGDLFELVVGSKFSGVHNRVSHHVGDNADPKTAYALLFYNLAVAVNGALVKTLIRGMLTLSLKANFHDVCGICN